MTMDFAERVTIDGHAYFLHAFPLEAYRKALPAPPRLRGWPGCSHGCRASWIIEGDGPGRMLVLVEAHPHEALDLLFAEPALPLAATWFSGVIGTFKGERRRTGYPPRTFHDDELYLKIVAGRVVREWVLDLRAVPDQSPEEWRQTVPAFLWKT